MENRIAPKDAEKKRNGFYIMRNKGVSGSPQPGGRGTQFIYLDDGRMVNSAQLVGNIKDDAILKLLTTAEGFKKLVYSIGVSVEMEEALDTMVDFVFQMYGKTDTYNSGTLLRLPVRADGMEYVTKLEEWDWTGDDKFPGQARFEFEKAGSLAKVSVKLYVNDGFDVPEPEEEFAVDFERPEYEEMLKKSLVQMGDYSRIKKAIEKAKANEDVTVAFIGGSITQGAGAVPINTECYAYKTYLGFCEICGKGVDENIHYIKAGVGGTPSELGMLRYDRDVLRDGKVKPDVVIVEFAVNDEGDETKGECYESLCRKILQADNEPAVILMFSVFSSDYNLQERLAPVGEALHLPMVSAKDCVLEQFYKPASAGRVLSKNQYFYDCYHPTNTGHTVMADCLIHLLKEVDAAGECTELVDVSKIPAKLGDEFTNVKLLDKKDSYALAKISCGDFSEQDEELQAVELDLDLGGTKELPYNWMHKSGSTPFVMDITCTALLLISKDSASPQVGAAEVWVDGKLALKADPHVVGWTHCNPQIVLRGAERVEHHVEIKMCEGDEDKEFTILGFGYVE